MREDDISNTGSMPFPYSPRRPFGFVASPPEVAARAEMTAARNLGWALVGALLVIDVPWAALIGLSIGGIWKAMATVGGLLALSAAYRRRSRGISLMAEHAALWIAFTATGLVLTYLCAACAFPLQDAALAEFDHALGFDWLAWRHAVLASPALSRVLFFTYGSLMPQIALAVFFFPTVGLGGRGSELLLLAILTFLPTTLISALCPALGPWSGGPYLPDMLALRAGGPWHFDLPTMQGIITMPSYHAVLAVLFIHAFRRTRIGWGIAALNAVMLLSVSPCGGHYLADIIGGGAIALLCILGWRRVSYRRRTTPALACPA